MTKILVKHFRQEWNKISVEESVRDRKTVKENTRIPNGFSCAVTWMWWSCSVDTSERSCWIWRVHLSRRRAKAKATARQTPKGIAQGTGSASRLHPRSTPGIVFCQLVMLHICTFSLHIAPLPPSHHTLDFTHSINLNLSNLDCLKMENYVSNLSWIKKNISSILSNRLPSNFVTRRNCYYSYHSNAQRFFMLKVAIWMTLWQAVLRPIFLQQFILFQFDHTWPLQTNCHLRSVAKFHFVRWTSLTKPTTDFRNCQNLPWKPNTNQQIEEMTFWEYFNILDGS